MSFTKTSALLFVFGLMLITWTANQALADIQTAVGSGMGVSLGRSLTQPDQAELAAIQLAVEQGAAPATPTPAPESMDPDEVLRATRMAEEAAQENTFLDLAEQQITPAAAVEDLADQELIPDRIIIPVIGLDAPVLPAEYTIIKTWGSEYIQWLAPESFAAGWHTSSVMLGQVGNMVLNGHHNAYGEVFGRLVDLKSGDLILVYSGTHSVTFQVANRMILPEKYETFNTRLENARWLQPTTDERLTLVTCWPKETNTHRLIIVARPLDTSPESTSAATPSPTPSPTIAGD